jgi:phospholipid transport system substrate-binding protein
MQRLIFALTAFLLAPLALAQEVAPDALVRSVSQEVLEIIRKDKDIQSGNTKRTMRPKCSRTSISPT